MAGNGDVSKVAQQAAGIGVKGQAIVPITGAVAAVGNRVSNRENVSDNGDNLKRKHNHGEEVIDSHQDHRESPAVTGRLEQPVNRL